ncbi:MAG: UDP-2,3-diacylglucosamine diphosphatase LpxI [Deltaproteobacteria bacterium]|nr:UDP-2,3-diacylglucosamine diphosphatase LpxI [Deltaproteobacteria bacterium]MDE0342017.1 UDP-2,3-diacylglucosamine diphosphatase LpxI [Deltaproteobacteria bacterium]
MTPDVPADRVGLIAGSGRFPLIFARNARQAGVRVIAVAHHGETDPEIEQFAAEVTWIRVGQLGRIIRTFHKAEVRHAVMAGGIRKVRMFSNFRPDPRGLALLARMRRRDDDHLLRGVAGELEGEGIRVVPSTIFLERIIPGTPGVLTRTEPSEQQWRDVRQGIPMAKTLGRMGIGQTLVLKEGVVLAVEAIEGTDAAIRRGGEVVEGSIVVVKMSKPDQDLRFDVPAIGPGTIDVLREAGGGVLAVECGRSILLDKEELLAAADDAGIAVVAAASEPE